jgi:hypothetical protein
MKNESAALSLQKKFATPFKTVLIKIKYMNKNNVYIG